MTLVDEAMDISALQQMAAGGDVGALTALAQRLVVGKNAPFEPATAIRLLQRAAAMEFAPAMVRLATLYMIGAWIPKDWQKGLALISRAAELGDSSAQSQIRLLAPKTDVRATRDSWKTLAESIDLDAWRRSVPKIDACEKPRIRIVRDFIDPNICDWMVSKSLGKYAPSMMFDGAKSNFLATRTCSDFKFDVTSSDAVIQYVREKVSAQTGIPISCMEPPQIFHYALGQEIKAHYDGLKLGDQGYGQSGTYKGDRIVTLLLYLNDDYDGGELVFPKVDFKFKGKKGDGVYFAHVDEDGNPERLSLHAALPVTRGEKYILSQWIHDRTFSA
jgi:hypothetical protein